jgi:general secretion pathway protein G
MKYCVRRNSRSGYAHWVVLGIIVLLAAATLLLPSRRLGCGSYSAPVKAQTDITTIECSITEYSINNNGDYPNTLQPLVMPDDNGHCYLEGHDRHVPTDPWKREYLYVPPTPGHPQPLVFTLGRDGKFGGDGDDADIDSDSVMKEDR